MNKMTYLLSMLATLARAEFECEIISLSCTYYSFELTLNEPCRKLYAGFGSLSDFYVNKKENLSSERCGFRNIDGTSKISYNFTECGTDDAEITQQNIIYKGVLFHKDGSHSASGRLYTFDPNFDYKFQCKIGRTLAASSNVLGAEINVEIPEDTNGVIKFKPPDTDLTILLAPDVFEGSPEDLIPVVASLNDDDIINVNVSHVVSIVLPLQPEWWLQLADLTGSEEEMETEICNTIEGNWNLTNKDSHIDNCNITLLEKIEINSDAPLIEQFPDLNQTLIEKFEKKIKLNFQRRRLGRQADNTQANYSDGLDVEVSLKVESTTAALNNEASINATIRAKEEELGTAVKGIAWLELMSTDESNLNDTVIFKQTWEEYQEKNKLSINQVGTLKVFSPNSGTSDNENNFVEVITSPTSSFGVWEFWWIPFMVIMILIILAIIVVVVIRRRRRKRRKVPPTIEY